MVPNLKEPYGKKTCRRLSDLGEYFADRKAVDEILSRGDLVVYEVYEHPVPQEGKHLIFATTVLFAGKVGDEFHFTKGHFHSRPDGAEVIVGMEGAGMVLLQDRAGRFRQERLEACSVVYSPPGWAHRTVNTSKEDLIFLSICRADVGHDYDTITTKGFAKRVVDKGD
ncbi:MAG: glucose-6-phosphate isomerase [Candidatus Krumholzibacteria bacterium]|nr:glucose-6-phosphate isomerase [Candidatus Krumholzibacteria bacterium]